MQDQRKPYLYMALVLVLMALGISFIHPYDRLTWVMEVCPIFIGLPILCMRYNYFPLTTLLYSALFFHALVLILGGAYTYARVPLGFELAHFFGLHRNPYDKIGHLFQGFVPTLLAREILVRGHYVRGSKMLAFILICIALAISALYELIEWGAALSLGQDADAFLGMQGDPWDTQSDMFCALIGACVALGLFSSLHDRQIKAIKSSE